MATSVLDEQLCSLSEIRQFLPATGPRGPVSPGCISRWITKGLRAQDGSTVYLEAVRAGRSFCTSREAVGRFFAELTARNCLPGNRAAAGRTGDDDTSRRLVQQGLKAGQRAAL